MLLFMPAHAAANDACPAGQVRETIEVVVTPAIVTDIHGEMQTLKSAVTRERVVPIIFEWVDKPKDYVRPENFTYQMRIGSDPTYKPIYESYVFREASFDKIVRLDGTRDIIYLPPIQGKKVTYAIDPNSATSKIETVSVPYDPATMEKDGKLKRVANIPERVWLNNSWLGKAYGPVMQTRTPALLKEVLGDCAAVK